jgi:TnpA family transposase
MPTNSERLNILSGQEQFALYGLPDFDDCQRMEYFIFTEHEMALVLNRQNVHAQVHCALQIGYFKAKQAFFIFSWDEVEEDCAFLLTRYFNDLTFLPIPITRHERYAQRDLIVNLFGYRLWAADFLPLLAERANQVVSRDVTPSFILVELITFLNDQKIVRPGYTTLQSLISETLSIERKRLGTILAEMLDESAKTALQQLLVREDTLSGLAALKQDAKHFGYRMMVLERQKRTTLEPLYQLAKVLLPKLAISQQNLNYYASLAHFYTIYDLRRLKQEQTHLYLLCYAWLRYRQLTDNLVDALGYRMKRLEDDTKLRANKLIAKRQADRQQETSQIGRLLLLYVDEQVNDATVFGEVRQQAFAIMPKDTLLITGQRLCEKPLNKLELRWQVVEQLSGHCRKHLRPLYGALDFASTVPDNPWLAALAWLKGVFAKQQRLSQQPMNECVAKNVPSPLRRYLLTLDTQGKATGVQADRYEFWIYRQIRKRFKSGELYLEDSVQHQCFTHELVSLERTPSVLQQLDIPWIRQPIKAQLKALTEELHHLWLAFDNDLRQGKLKHLEYDSQLKTLTWHRYKANKDKALQENFYSKLGFCNVADVLRFVNEQCHFLSAMTPLQPRYAKQIADKDSLFAVIIAQAMNFGNLKIAQTSDIPYHILETTHQQYMRRATLKAANDTISNAIAGLSIFPHYSFDLGVLYGAVDGQKLGVERPTIKARNSRKYFGRGKGVVAYTMLCNHVPVNGGLIGAHQFEAHFLFDIWYQNTSDIIPTVITGDMHSINKANFAVTYWFGLQFEPRFTDLDAQLKNLYCCGDPAQFEKCLIQPIGSIDLQAIKDEKPRIDQIVATLGLKEMTQSTLIRKLCTYTQSNPTRSAIFEYDKLIRSIYTLRYLRDPQVERNAHRSQNRIESYHQLRAAIAQVGGKKELTGRTDLDIEISNECGRLIANAIIYYNSAILSRILDKYEASPNPKILALIKKVSPAAWRNIHFNGHYAFRDSGQRIDLDAIMANLVLE